MVAGHLGLGDAPASVAGSSCVIDKKGCSVPETSHGVVQFDRKVLYGFGVSVLWRVTRIAETIDHCRRRPLNGRQTLGARKAGNQFGAKTGFLQVPIEQRFTQGGGFEDEACQSADGFFV